MKKIISMTLAVLLIAVLMVPVFADSSAPLLVDDADLLSAEEENVVIAKLNTISDELDFDVAIVTVTDLGNKDIMDFADDYYDYNGYGTGRQGDRSGALLLVYDNGSGSTQRWISTRGYGITAFTDYGIQYVGKQLVPLMDNGEWLEACIKYADLSYDLVQRANEGKPLDVEGSGQAKKSPVMGIIVSLIVGIVIALIVTGIIKKRYKPVSFKANASDYLVNGSLNVTGAHDNFRTTSVTRTAIQSSSSGGSSTHRSSSGASHGGGGF